MSTMSTKLILFFMDPRRKKDEERDRGQPTSSVALDEYSVLVVPTKDLRKF